MVLGTFVKTFYIEIIWLDIISLRSFLNFVGKSYSAYVQRIMFKVWAVWAVIRGSSEAGLFLISIFNISIVYNDGG